jgi:ubiquinone/menaquinone biosynthesis C-methylase UbiE
MVQPVNGTGPGTTTPPSATHFEAMLTKLVAEIPVGADPVLDAYRESSLGDTTFSTSIKRQVRAFLLYRKYAESGRRFLDWGCRHALDSCMVRMVNPTATIKGCDINDSMTEPAQRFTGIDYTQLGHPWKLPYDDASFDRIIASGVLEHVPLPNASLMELNRVTESGGYLIVTFLPNRWSYTEFSLRRIFKHGQHRRLYTRSQIKQLLLDHGFEPIATGYHQLLPSLTMGHKSLKWPWLGDLFRALFKADPVVERIWPLRLFCANLYAVARKRDYM